MTVIARWPLSLLLLCLAFVGTYFVAPDLLTIGPGSVLLSAATFFYGFFGLFALALLATSRLHGLDLAARGFTVSHVLAAVSGALILAVLTAATQDTETIKILAMLVPLATLVCITVVLWHARRQKV